MKRFLAGAGIAAALAIIAVYRVSNPVPVGDKGPRVKLVLASRDLEPRTILRAKTISCSLIGPAKCTPAPPPTRRTLLAVA